MTGLPPLHGRLLPEELRHRWEDYASYRFYSYSPGLPPIPDLDEATKRRLKERLEQAATNPPKRHEGFLADLYKAGTRGQTEAGIVTVNLMGFDVRVHEQVAEPPKGMGRLLGILVETDPGVQRFVDGLKGLAGYNWREIAGTQSKVPTVSVVSRSARCGHSGQHEPRIPAILFVRFAVAQE